MTSAERHRESCIDLDIQGLALRAPVLQAMLDSYVRGECDLRNACRQAHHELLQQTRDGLLAAGVERSDAFTSTWPRNELSARPEALPSPAQIETLVHQVGCWELVREMRRRMADARSTTADEPAKEAP